MIKHVVEHEPQRLITNQRCSLLRSEFPLAAGKGGISIFFQRKIDVKLTDTKGGAVEAFAARGATLNLVKVFGEIAAGLPSKGG